MALMTREQAEDTRQRMLIVAQSMLETDAGRVELVKLATEISALADEARTRAQFSVIELNRSAAPPPTEAKPQQRDGDEAIYIP